MNTIKELKEENKMLKEKNIKLVDDLKVISKKINMFEQNSVRNNVEILGVPESSNENCAYIVKNIAVKLDVKLSVVKAYRIHTNILNKSKKIIAEIDSFENKKSLMENMKKRKLNTNNVNEAWGEGNIFINNELSPFNRELFYKVRMFAKKNAFKFVWFNELKIFIKKNEISKAYIIQEECDLLKLL